MMITIKEIDKVNNCLGNFKLGQYFIYKDKLYIATSDYIPQNSVHCVELNTGKVVVLRNSTLVKAVKAVNIEYILYSN